MAFLGSRSRHAPLGPARADHANVLAPQEHASTGFALLLGRPLLRTRSRAGPGGIRAVGGRADREPAGGAGGK